MLMASDYAGPLNIESDELVTINQLVDLAEEIPGVRLKRRHNLHAPRGVAGRNSDNTRIRQVLGWAPGIPSRVGLKRTYAWIYDQLSRR